MSLPYLPLASYHVLFISLSHPRRFLATLSSFPFHFLSLPLHFLVTSSSLPRNLSLIYPHCLFTSCHFLFTALSHPRHYLAHSPHFILTSFYFLAIAFHFLLFASHILVITLYLLLTSLSNERRNLSLPSHFLLTSFSLPSHFLLTSFSLPVTSSSFPFHFMPLPGQNHLLAGCNSLHMPMQRSSSMNLRSFSFFDSCHFQLKEHPSSYSLWPHRKRRATLIWQRYVN